MNPIKHLFVDKLPFPNPPIKEALIDIRTELPPEINLETLSSLQDKISDKFPERKKRFSWKSGFQFKEGSAPEVLQSSGGQDGYIFKTRDGKKIVQARLNGFTFNKLKPYDSWEILSQEAKELWEIFITIAKPKNVTKLALRYINVIELPFPFKDFKEYLTTQPPIAKGIPDNLFSYFVTLEINDPNKDLCARVIQAFKPLPKEAKILSFIFDIEVYKDVQLSPNDPSVWLILEELRHFKNKIFLNSLTSKTKELFK